MRPNLQNCAVFALLTIAAPTTSAGEDNWHVVVAGSEWSWGEDYAFAYAKYIVACEPGRSCGIGTGISINKHPLGSKQTIVGVGEVAVFGIGSIHFRAADSKGPVRVKFLMTDKALAKLPKITW